MTLTAYHMVLKGHIVGVVPGRCWHPLRITAACQGFISLMSIRYGAALNLQLMTLMLALYQVKWAGVTGCNRMLPLSGCHAMNGVRHVKACSLPDELNPQNVPEIKARFSICESGFLNCQQQSWCHCIQLLGLLADAAYDFDVC